MQVFSMWAAGAFFSGPTCTNTAPGQSVKRRSRSSIKEQVLMANRLSKGKGRKKGEARHPLPHLKKHWPWKMLQPVVEPPLRRSVECMCSINKFFLDMQTILKAWSTEKMKSTSKECWLSWPEVTKWIGFEKMWVIICIIAALHASKQQIAHQWCIKQQQSKQPRSKMRSRGKIWVICGYVHLTQHSISCPSFSQFRCWRLVLLIMNTVFPGLSENLTTRKKQLARKVVKTVPIVIRKDLSMLYIRKTILTSVPKLKRIQRMTLNWLRQDSAFAVKPPVSL